MFNDRRELPIAKDFVAKMKDEIMDLEIQKRQIEEQIVLKWKKLMGGICHVEHYERNIDDEKFVLEHSETGDLWDGRKWMPNLDSPKLYKESSLPEEFEGCLLERNNQEDPINWEYYPEGEDDDDSFCCVVRVRDTLGRIQFDR